MPVTDWNKPIEFVSDGKAYPARVLCSNLKSASELIKVAFAWTASDGNEYVSQASLKADYLRNVPPAPTKKTFFTYTCLTPNNNLHSVSYPVDMNWQVGEHPRGAGLPGKIINIVKGEVEI